jgi:hypothetical protein
LHWRQPNPAQRRPDSSLLNPGACEPRKAVPCSRVALPPNSRTMKLLSGLFVIVASTLQSQSIYDLFGTDQFHRAYLTANSNEVTFDPFQELNWEAKARIALPWLNLDRPTPPQIARLSTFESAGPQFRSVGFRAPLDSAVSRATYLLIYIGGVIPLQPVQLKGSVDFDFDTGMTVVQRKVVSGTVVGKPSRAVTTTAFVFIGKPADVKDVHPGVKFEKSKQAGSAVYSFTNGNRTVTWTTSAKEQPDVSSAVSFRLADEQLLLVKWDNDFCGSAYTLFSVDTSLQPIAGNAYDCDA